MVIQFPTRSEPHGRRVRGIQACLNYLYEEAVEANLPVVALLLGAAREEIEVETSRLDSTSRS
jgi:hypothetical protein